MAGRFIGENIHLMYDLILLILVTFLVYKFLLNLKKV